MFLFTIYYINKNNYYILSHLSGLESISSVCTSPVELIQSEDFIKGIQIILKTVDKYDADHILSIFYKLQKDEILSQKENTALTSFLLDKDVKTKGKRLLSSLKNIPNRAETKNHKETLSFAKFLTSIFSRNAYNKIQESIFQIAQKTEKCLNKYDGFTGVTINVLGEERVVYLEDTTLKVDSRGWERIQSGRLKEYSDNIKISPERDIIERLEGVAAGEQLFTREAAIREATKQGKRLPFMDKENPEFQAIIAAVGVEEFIKVLPGYSTIGPILCPYQGEMAYYWSASTRYRGEQGYIAISNDGDQIFDNFCPPSMRSKRSVRCVKD